MPQFDQVTFAQWLTVDSRSDHNIKDLAAVAGINELIGTQRVEAQRSAARLVLRFYHYHHIETVAGKIFSLDDKKETLKDMIKIK